LALACQRGSSAHDVCGVNWLARAHRLTFLGVGSMHRTLGCVVACPMGSFVPRNLDFCVGPWWFILVFGYPPLGDVASVCMYVCMIKPKGL